MERIEFTRAEKDRMVQKILRYFETDLDLEIGQFDAEFLIDFFAEEIGAFFYNRGLYDAEKMLATKLADISDELLQLEKPVDG
ncbi:DUF2164 domain-containing protein [Thiomicrorhabdus sp.]|uniref:DUF2164 domain-containing protein n=1 Tax=Thiomicrorhabdus sp. TaxID=2039724 RepID=UPI0029C924CB|nr:DUF2164 domain-containing protein [Thiomicrorhabdus sp.]